MTQTVKISAVIITYDEERNIGRCLDSIKEVADEVVVVDSYSKDETEKICRDKGAIFLQHPFKGHIEQKNYAVSCATYDYILSLDADEVLSEELRQSILHTKRNWRCDGYVFNRLTNYCGKWIRHCGWYPDPKLRLWDRKKGRWGGVNPHDHVFLDENSGIQHLNGNLLHYSYPSIRHHIAQMNAFSEIAARAAYENGQRAHLIIDICLNPMLTFLKKYFLKLGILDGYEGFVISVNTAYGKFLKYTKLRELNKTSGLSNEDPPS